MNVAALAHLRRASGARLAGLVLVTFVLLAASQPAPAHPRAGSRWLLEALGTACTPTQPERFTAGWGAGFGIGGSLRRELGGRLELGVDAEFVQFSYTGLRREGDLGGERRFGRVGVPVRVHLWERESAGRERLSLQASAGWGRQSTAAIFGAGRVSEPKEENGLAVTGELRFARVLFRATRWSAGLRYAWFSLETESPGHFGLVLGVEMPLSGSRAQ